MGNQSILQLQDAYKMIGLSATLFIERLTTALENFMLFNTCNTFIGKRGNVYVQFSSKSVFKSPYFSLKPQR